MDSFEEHFKKIHRGDLKTLLKIYWENKPIYNSPYFRASFAISLFSIILPIFFPIQKLEVIEFLANSAVAIFPSILGFNLGGYILLISLSTSKILNEVTEPDQEKGEEYSFYQKMSSVFAFSLLLQAFSLICGIALTMIIKIGKGHEIVHWLAETINSFVLIMMSFIITYSTILIWQIILNIFNYGQVLHFFIRIERLEEQDSTLEKK